jgi:alkaline phosphatase
MQNLLRFSAALARILLLLTFAVFASGSQTASSQAIAPIESHLPKFIFLFLADGGGTAHLEITRQYRQELLREGMVITDKIMREGSIGLLTTHAADSLSTDSAAAATALASGCKANVGALGVCADGSMPSTVMEKARQLGLRIGLVTNSTVYDASPAAFVCHVPNRRDYTAILKRYLDLGPDVLMGGGRAHFLPQGQLGSQRKDQTDIAAAFVEKGYQQVLDKAALEQARPGKILGLFSLGEMSFEIERDTKNEPSVYDMTRAAIRQLHDNNPDGFFLFVENENIDSASHLTDVASLIHDYRELDRAVGLAYEFYTKYPRETLILVTSDHETGGLGFTMALQQGDKIKSASPVAGKVQDLEKIRSIKISLRTASRLLGSKPTAESIDHLVREHFGAFTLPAEYKELILKQRPVSRTIYLDPTANALGMMIAHQTQAYWQTSSHTNQPVVVAALGAGAERFGGYYDNADFGKKLMAILNGQRIAERVP